MAVAARRLGLDDGVLAEGALHAMSNGQTEGDAIRIAGIDAVRLQGRYDGRVKRMIDNGTIFESEDGIENHL